MEYRISKIEDMEGAAREFISALGERRHVALHAGMGVGKTTFVAALCRVLGMEDEATSPTFSIVNEYQGENPSFSKIYHFDFYRIESPEETMDLGLDDYFDSGTLCLMEWPENVEGFLPDDTVDLFIEEEADGTRVMRMD